MSFARKIIAQVFTSTEGEHFDCAIIGAGMSGLAAGIRLAQFGKRVVILEKHNAPGGLNSFYSINGRKYDVGLHALTNYVEPGVKGTPLGKILRQLRINREEWDLSPQKLSTVRFSDAAISFTNDIEFLKNEVRQHFPHEIDGLQQLIAAMQAHSENEWLETEGSTKTMLSEFIKDPLLLEMIICPVLFYGSAQENDMPWGIFAILFRAIFLEGLGRPYEGIRVIIRSLLEKFRSVGGERRMKCGVKRMRIANDRVTALELDSGETIVADCILSSAGFSETMALCDVSKLNDTDHSEQNKISTARSATRLSFVETMSVYRQQPQDWGWNETIVFFNEGSHFTYENPKTPVDLRSGVICIPNNYAFSNGRTLTEGMVRITALANYTQWANLPEETYRTQKKEWFAKLTQQAQRFLPEMKNGLDLSKDEIDQDMFTPRTIHKFTKHIGGSVYGSPTKTPNGTTPLHNLFIIGTDQGLLGITGALMSGISMANRHVLQKTQVIK